MIAIIKRFVWFWLIRNIRFTRASVTFFFKVTDKLATNVANALRELLFNWLSREFAAASSIALLRFACERSAKLTEEIEKDELFSKEIEIKSAFCKKFWKVSISFDIVITF